MRYAAFAVVMLAGPLSPAIALEGDPERGERAFQLCYACHSVQPEERNLPGPNLNDVIGRGAAALEEFDYSDAMRAKAANGLVWTGQTLDRYLADPEAMIPGTAMAVNGIPDAQKRADVIAYLKAAGQ